MTVIQLISMLLRYNPDLEVYSYANDESRTPAKVEYKEVYLDDKKKFDSVVWIQGVDYE